MYFFPFLYSCMKTNAWIEKQIIVFMHWTSLDKMWSLFLHADLLFLRIGPFKYVEIAFFGQKSSQNEHFYLFEMPNAQKLEVTMHQKWSYFIKGSSIYISYDSFFNQRINFHKIVKKTKKYTYNHLKRGSNVTWRWKRYCNT